MVRLGRAWAPGKAVRTTSTRETSQLPPASIVERITVVDGFYREVAGSPETGLDSKAIEELARKLFAYS
jgi:hypothetical protein